LTGPSPLALIFVLIVFVEGFKTYKLQTNSLLDYIIAPKLAEGEGAEKPQPAARKFVSRHEIPISQGDDCDRQLFANKETFTYTHKQEYLIKLNKDSPAASGEGAAKEKDAAKACSGGHRSQPPSVKSRTKVGADSPRSRSWVFKFTNCLDSGDDDENRRLAAIKAGPKKSHEWALFSSSNKSSQVASGDESEAEAPSASVTVTNY